MTATTAAGGAPASGTQAIDRAAELVALVVRADTPRSFGSLMDQTGLAKSTGSRLLHALERHQLLSRDDEGWSPGPLFTLHAARREPWADLVRTAEPTLHRLGELSKETVNLAVPRGDAVVEVAQVDTAYVLGATNWIGVEVPAHCTALGKVFYAHDRLTVPSGRLEQRTAASVGTAAQLRRQLPGIRRAGYAVTRGELEPGLCAVAAAVHDATGVVAAISVSGPDTRVAARVRELGELVHQEATALSALLGHRPARPTPRNEAPA